MPATNKNPIVTAKADWFKRAEIAAWLLRQSEIPAVAERGLRLAAALHRLKREARDAWRPDLN